MSWYLCASGSAKENPEFTKLAEGVYVRIVSPDGNAVSNSGIIVLEHSVLVFDTHFTPEAGQDLLAGVRSVTAKPVRYVVNSHAHADHTHGNQVFSDVQLIGSTNARREILELDLPSLNRTIGVTRDQLEKLRQQMSVEKDAAQVQHYREQIKPREDYLQTLSHIRIAPPSVTLDDNLTIQDGKQEVRILSLGIGHTDGDLILFLPSLKIAFVGDLFFCEAIPNVQDASILQWMKTLKEVLKMDAEKFVPGHGRVGSKKDVEAFLGYLEELQSMVQPFVDRGDSADQATGEIRLPAEYVSYQFQNLFPSNIQKMYAELKALQISSKPAEDRPPVDSKKAP